MTTAVARRGTHEASFSRAHETKGRTMPQFDRVTFDPQNQESTVNMQLGIQVGLSLIASALLLPAEISFSAGVREKILVTSSIDRTEQPCYLILPDGFDEDGPAVPLLVCLHTWSGSVEQRRTDTELECGKRGWIFLFPNFRGPNSAPDACGSLKAQQDILDAVDWVLERYPVDEKRIYLTGASGGGHMSMLMAGRYRGRRRFRPGNLLAPQSRQGQGNHF